MGFCVEVGTAFQHILLAPSWQRAHQFGALGAYSGIQVSHREAKYSQIQLPEGIDKTSNAQLEYFAAS